MRDNSLDRDSVKKLNWKGIRMNTKALLENLLQSGKELAAKGQAVAEEKLGLPAEGSDRDAQMSGLKKGAIAGGLLALLLGTRSGRKLTGTALKWGSLAAIGGVGYKAYKKWQEQQGATEELGSPILELNDEAAEKRSTILVKAMIAAAKADGHIDAEEISRIKGELAEMNLDATVASLLESEIAKPLSVAEVAAEADSPAAAVEMYLASKLVIDDENVQERTYLNDLARELQLPGQLIEQVDAESNA